MPSRPKRPCAVPGCPQLTDSHYCPDHQQQYGKREAWKQAVESSAAARGYGAPWRRKRARILQRDGYLCQVCRLRDATDVDHIVPKFKGGTDDDSNLQAICDGCHKVKTLKEREEARKQRNSTPGAGRNRQIEASVTVHARQTFTPAK